MFAYLFVVVCLTFSLLVRLSDCLFARASLLVSFPFACLFVCLFSGWLVGWRGCLFVCLFVFVCVFTRLRIYANCCLRD